MADLNSGHGGPARRTTARAIVGLALALVGSLTLCGLIFMTNAEGHIYQRLMFALGLGLTGLVSALAQVLVLYGLWLLWTAVHRR